MKDEKWISVKSMPLETYVLICTEARTVRIAKKVSYKDGSQAVTYAGVKFKNVTHWMPLPKPPQV